MKPDQPPNHQSADIPHAMGILFVVNLDPPVRSGPPIAVERLESPVNILHRRQFRGGLYHGVKVVTHRNK